MATLFTDARRTEMYQFFNVAFNAAPGLIYLSQLRDAVESGLSTKDIVNIFTTKSQFLSVYPSILTNLDFANRLVNNVIKDSASSVAKMEAVNDIVSSLNLGLSRGDVIFQVFSNLANITDPGNRYFGVATQFQKQLIVARYYTEALLGSAEDVLTLQRVIRNVTNNSDVSTDAAIQNLINGGTSGANANLVVTAQAPSVNEGTSTFFSITGADANSDLSFTITGVQQADILGGQLTGTTRSDSNGNAFVSLGILNDNLTEGTEVLTFTVAGKSASTNIVDTSRGNNIAPVAPAATNQAAEGGPAISGTIAATDANGDVLTYSLVTPVPGLVLNSNGTYTFNPASNPTVQALRYSDPAAQIVANYSVSDGQANATNTLTITVSPTPLTFTITPSASSAEGAPATFVVTASENLTSNLDVQFTVNPGNTAAGNSGSGQTNLSDFTPGTLNRTVTIPAGSNTATFTVTPAGDVVTELTEAYTVSAVVNGVTLTSNGSVSDAAPPQTFTLTASSPTVTEGNSGTTTTLNFVLDLGQVANSPVTLNVVTTTGGTATSGTDFVPLSTTVTIPTGQRTVTVPVTVNGDGDFEPNETVQISISGAQLTGTVTATGTITNDDDTPFTLSVAPAGTRTVAEGDTGAQVLSYTLTLNKAPTVPVTFQVAVASGNTATSGSDFNLLTTFATFNPGDPLSKSFDLVSIVGDTTPESTEALTLQITGNLTQAVSLPITITDNDNGNNFVLTTGNDSLTGGALTDVFTGTVGILVSTFNNGDQLNGGAGTADRLNLTTSTDFGGATTPAFPANPTGAQGFVRGIEILSLTNGAAGTRTFNAANIADVDTIEWNAAANNGSLIVNQLGKAITSLSVTGVPGAGGVALNHVAPVVDGAADRIALTLNGVGTVSTATVPAVGTNITTMGLTVETANITAIGTNNAINLGVANSVGTQAINVTGAGNLEVTGVLNSVRSFDASSATGVINATFAQQASAGTLQLATIVGGAGNDTITLSNSTALQGTATVGGGGGTDDRLVFNTITGTPIIPTLTGFETLEFKSITGTNNINGVNNSGGVKTVVLSDGAGNGTASTGSLTLRDVFDSAGVTVVTQGVNNNNTLTLNNAGTATFRTVAATTATATAPTVVGTSVTFSEATGAASVEVGANTRFGTPTIGEANFSKASSLAINATGALGDATPTTGALIVSAAEATSVNLNTSASPQGTTLADFVSIVAPKAATVNLTANRALNLLGSDLTGVRSFTASTTDALIGAVNPPLNVNLISAALVDLSGSTTNSRVTLGNVGSAALTDAVSITASGLRAGLILGDIDSVAGASLALGQLTGNSVIGSVGSGTTKGNVSATFGGSGSAMMGAVTTEGSAIISATGVQGNLSLGAINAVGGATLTLGGVTGTTSIASVGNPSTTGTINATFSTSATTVTGAINTTGATTINANGGNAAVTTGAIGSATGTSVTINAANRTGSFTVVGDISSSATSTAARSVDIDASNSTGMLSFANGAVISGNAIRVNASNTTQLVTLGRIIGTDVTIDATNSVAGVLIGDGPNPARQDDITIRSASGKLEFKGSQLAVNSFGITGAPDLETLNATITGGQGDDDIAFTGDVKQKTFVLSGNLLGGTADVIFINVSQSSANQMVSIANLLGVERTEITSGGGDDQITGGTGNDSITGGAGADVITGGAGADVMSGGVAADIFAYGSLATIAAQTGITLATADTIGDFSGITGTQLDKIKTGTAGTAANYSEAAQVANFATALAAADAAMNATVLYHLTSTAADGGLLFVDGNADGTADAVIKLTGITSANFEFADIIA